MSRSKRRKFARKNHQKRTTLFSNLFKDRRRSLHFEALEDRRLLSGVTLLTHGFQLLTTYPGWVDRMAQEVGNRIEAAQPGKTWSWYHIEVGDLPTFGSTFEKKSAARPDVNDATSGEIVITLDWSDISTIGTAGRTQEVAGIVADGLLSTFPSKGIDTPLAELPLHLIGHSRGASVVGALAEDLGQAGIWVDQVTYLDTRPVDRFEAGGLEDDWGYSDFDVTENIVFADSYFRQDGLFGEPFDFDGRYVDGAHNAELDEDYFDMGIGSLLEHSDVHTWYHGTVDAVGNFSDGDVTVTDPSVWYSASAYIPTDGGIPSGRSQTGFAYSRIGGVSRPSAGLVPFLGGVPNSRDAVPTPNPDWANVGYLDVGYLSGGLLNIDFYYDTPNGNDALFSFYLDTNQNPYDDIGVSLGNVSKSSSTPTNGSFAAPVPVGTADDIYYVVAQSSYNGKVRYFYSTDTETTHTITASAGPSGSIDPSGTLVAPEGSTITFTASPDTGHVADKWYVNGVHQSEFDGQEVVSTPVHFGGSIFVSFRPESTNELIIERPAVDPYPTSESSVYFAGTAPTGNHHVTWKNLATGHTGDTGADDISTLQWEEHIFVEEGENPLIFSSWADLAETQLLGTATISVERSSDIRVATVTDPIEAFVWSADPTQEFPGEDVYVGWDESLGGGFEWTYVQFDLPQFPAGSTIESATFIAEDNGGVGDAPLTIDVNQVIDPWSEGTVNWNNKPNVISNDRASTDVSLDEHAEWNVSAIVDRWYSGDDNYGLRMRAPDVGTSSTHERRFEGHEFELEITYRIETTPPLIDIELPTDEEEYWINTDTVRLEGDAHDTHGLSHVSWYNHDDETTGIAAGTTDWLADIHLIPGRNLLEVQAEDASENKSSDYLTVYYLVSPQGITATSDMQAQILTQWNPVDGASFYRVYRSDSEGGTRSPVSGWIDAIEFTDTNIALGNSYFYWVTAGADASGNAESQFGSFAIGGTPTPPPPSADFDNDGDTDGLDFLAWQRGFGTDFPDASKANGDADNDLDVDGDDLSIWETQFGASLGIDEGLAGYYPFDSNFLDASANGNHGAETGGVTFVTGVDGQAASFDGIDDSVEFPTLNNGSKTFALWFNTDATNIDGFGRLLSYDGGVFHDLWALMINDGNLIFSGRESTLGDIPQLESDTIVNDNEWHFGVVTLDDDADEARLYVDGVLEDSSDQMSVSLTMFDHPFFAMHDVHSDFVQGQLDGIRIWDRALSASEVSTLATTPSVVLASNLSTAIQPEMSTLSAPPPLAMAAMAAAVSSEPEPAMAIVRGSQTAAPAFARLSADLVDLAIAVKWSTQAESESRLKTTAWYWENYSDGNEHLANSTQPLAWHDASGIAGHSSRSEGRKLNVGGFDIEARADSAYEELVDQLFAEDELVLLL